MMTPTLAGHETSIGLHGIDVVAVTGVAFWEVKVYISFAG